MNGRIGVTAFACSTSCSPCSGTRSGGSPTFC